MALSRQQQNYVDVVIKQEAMRKSMSSPEEMQFKDILLDIGLIEDKDFKHQFCLHGENLVIVVDFFFPKINLVLDLDGADHSNTSKAKLDKMRDRLCKINGYTTIRIKTPMTKERRRYWQLFLREALREDDGKPA